MFNIGWVTLPSDKSAIITQVKPLKARLSFASRLGPQGSEYLITIAGLGVIHLVDIGDTVSGPATWAVRINDKVNWFYEGEGQMGITVDKFGEVLIYGGAGNVTASIILNGPSVTVDQNWPTYQPFANPNIFIGDINGNPILPQHAVECHLWAVVQNNGTEDAQAVSATFFIPIPATNLLWPAAAHGSNSIPDLPSGSTVKIMCSIPWIPDLSSATHQCIVAVVSCLDCPSPPTVPGTPVPLTGVGRDQQVGLNNVVVNTVANTSDAAIRHFNIHNARHSGILFFDRMPLSENMPTLNSKGLNANTRESPKEEKLSIVRTSDGKVYGSRMAFKAGESYQLHTEVHNNKIEPGTAAIYHIQHFENNNLVGGATQLIVHT